MTVDTVQPTELKGKELAFALAYIELGPVKGRNAQAAVKAGYAQKTAAQTGYKMLKKPHIAAYVRAREGKILEVIEEKQLVKREWIIEQLKLVYAQAMNATPVMVWDGAQRKMVESGEYTFDSRGANRALELLGKTVGMFSDKKDAPTDAFNLTINLAEGAKEQKLIEHEAAQPVSDVPTINLGE